MKGFGASWARVDILYCNPRFFAARGPWRCTVYLAALGREYGIMVNMEAARQSRRCVYATMGMC